MTTQQGLKQASFRAIGGTATTIAGDMMAAFAAEATLPAGVTFNGAFIAWLRERTSSSDGSLNGLAQQFAEDEGAHNFASLGSFDPLS